MLSLELIEAENIVGKYKFKEATQDYDIEVDGGVVERSTSFSTPDAYINLAICVERNVQIPPMSKLLILNTCRYKPIHGWTSVEITDKISKVICSSTDKNETILLLGTCCPLSNNHLWRLRRLVAPRKVIGESFGYKYREEPMRHIMEYLVDSGLSIFLSLISRLESKGYLILEPDFKRIVDNAVLKRETAVWSK